MTGPVKPVAVPPSVPAAQQRAQEPAGIDPEKIQRFKTSLARLGIPLTAEAEEFLRRRRRNTLAQFLTDEQTQAEDDAEDQEDEQR